MNPEAITQITNEAGGLARGRSAGSGSRLWALVRIVALVTGLAGLAALGFYLHLLRSDNFACVVSGLVYRSDQMDARALARAMSANHIRCVLNLRGKNAGRVWYDQEIEACAHAGVQHEDFAISALHELSPERCDELLSVIAAAPKPLLIHCEAGADRTGLASALVLLRADVSPDVAHRQLCIWRLHFPYLSSQTKAMDRSFDAYVERAR